MHWESTSMRIMYFLAHCLLPGLLILPVQAHDQAAEYSNGFWASILGYYQKSEEQSWGNLTEEQLINLTQRQPTYTLNNCTHSELLDKCQSMCLKHKTMYFGIQGVNCSCLGTTQGISLVTNHTDLQRNDTLTLYFPEKIKIGPDDFQMMVDGEGGSNADTEQCTDVCAAITTQTDRGALTSVIFECTKQLRPLCQSAESNNTDNNWKYLLGPMNMTWTNAELYCWENNGSLINVHDFTSHDCTHFNESILEEHYVWSGLFKIPKPKSPLCALAETYKGVTTSSTSSSKTNTQGSVAHKGVSTSSPPSSTYHSSLTNLPSVSGNHSDVISTTIEANRPSEKISTNVQGMTTSSPSSDSKSYVMYIAAGIGGAVVMLVVVVVVIGCSNKIRSRSAVKKEENTTAELKYIEPEKKDSTSDFGTEQTLSENLNSSPYSLATKSSNVQKPLPGPYNEYTPSSTVTIPRPSYNDSVRSSATTGSKDTSKSYTIDSNNQQDTTENQLYSKVVRQGGLNDRQSSPIDQPRERNDQRFSNYAHLHQHTGLSNPGYNESTYDVGQPPSGFYNVTHGNTKQSYDDFLYDNHRSDKNTEDYGDMYTSFNEPAFKQNKDIITRHNPIYMDTDKV